MNKEPKRCEFDGCENYSQARRGGLCGGHRRQIDRGRELQPLQKKARKYDPICSFEGCGLVQFTKGYCQGHAQQFDKGWELAELKAVNFWVDGKKVCPDCGIKKDEADYPRSTKDSSGFSAYCRGCARWRQIESKYKLTKDEWLAIFEYQGSCCAVCGEEDPGSVKGWHTDHDHACCPGKTSCGKCVRGIACHGCNLRLDRSTDHIYSAYRKRHAARGIPLVDLVMKRFGLIA